MAFVLSTSVTLSNGVPIEPVSKILGHTSLETIQIYAKIIDKKNSEDMEFLKDKIGISNIDLKFNIIMPNRP